VTCCVCFAFCSRIVAFASAKYKRVETALAEFAASTDAIASGVAGVLLQDLLGCSVVDVWGGTRSPSRPPSPSDDVKAIPHAQVVCALPVLQKVLPFTIDAAEAGVVVERYGAAISAAVNVGALRKALVADASVCDEGWMYRDIRVPAGFPSDSVAGCVNDNVEAHVVWLTDFF
jgi:hypothetical protein